MIKLFFSYSHKDEEFRNQLEVHLSILKRNGVIETWYDRRIGAGEEIDNKIDENLLDSKIILLLVSPDFINSDYCYENEMKRAMEMHENGQARVIPIILRPCVWNETPFKKLKVLPTDGKPIIKYPIIDEAYVEITAAISSIAKSLNQKNSIANELSLQIISEKQETKIKKTIRSSNLRIRKNFTDRDKDQFLEEAFQYIAKYIENSLDELKRRNKDIDRGFKIIDAHHFTASLYRNGEIKSKCFVSLRTEQFLGPSISYSTENRDNSYNELLSVEADENSLYLKSMGMHNIMIMRTEEEKLTYEGGAELFWSILKEPLEY